MVIDALERLRATRKLAELDQHDREAAMAGAIGVRPRRIGVVAGRAVLLVDDVLTTGATASSCAEALHRAGAVSVDVLAIARVVDAEQD